MMAIRKQEETIEYQCDNCGGVCLLNVKRPRITINMWGRLDMLHFCCVECLERWDENNDMVLSRAKSAGLI